MLAHYGVGVVRELTDEDDYGASEFREAIRLKSDFGEAQVHLAHVLIEQRHFPEARAALDDAARLKPDDPALHYVRGLYFKSQGDPEKALTELRRSIQLAPQVPEAHYEMGLLLRQRGELESAAGEFRKAIELSPADGPSLLNLAQILGLQGKRAESEEVIRKFRDVRKKREAAKQAQVDNDTAIRLVERGELNAGIGHFRAALDLRPDDPDFHRNLALALFRTGQFGQARKEYEKAIGLNPRDWQAHCGLGEVLERQHQLADSITEVESAVRLNPRYAEAYQLLSRLYREAKDPIKAAAALKRAQSLAAEANTGRN